MSAHSIDSSDASFGQDVIDESHRRPVLVDFWAGWCAPCRSLKPVLEKLAEEAGGRFLLVKIDADRNPETTASHGVRSLPTVKAFRDGIVVDEFMGALPESAVRDFLSRILPSPAELAQREGRAHLDAGDADGAVAILGRALALDPRSDSIRVDLAEAHLRAGAIDAARAALADLSPLADRQPDLARALASLRIELAAAGTDDEEALRQRVGINPDDLAGRQALAQRLAAAGDMAGALDQYLEIIRRDRKYGDDAGRRGMVQIFDLLGSGDPLVGKYRRLLAASLN